MILLLPHVVTLFTSAVSSSLLHFPNPLVHDNIHLCTWNVTFKTINSSFLWEIYILPNIICKRSLKDATVHTYLSPNWNLRKWLRTRHLIKYHHDERTVLYGHAGFWKPSMLFCLCAADYLGIWYSTIQLLHTHMNTHKNIHDKFPIHTVLVKYLRSLPTLASSWGSLQSHVMCFRFYSCTAHSGYEYGVDTVKYPLHLPWHFKVLLPWHGTAYGQGT